ncbi:MAG: YfiR family protein [Rhodospirillaceae bacterium]
MISALWPPRAYGADPLTREYQIKGAYLYKLADYVEWPAAAFASPASPLTICVVGRDPFGGALDQVTAGERVAGHVIEIKRLAAADPSVCHVAYFSGPTGAVLDTQLAGYDGKSVLTITDGIGEGARRGIINFVLRDDRVRFEIDEQAASDVKLAISSKLLSLATTVRRSR